MNLLLIVDCYLPEERSSAVLMHDLAAELAQRGHSVTLLAPSSELRMQCELQQATPFQVVRYRAGRMKGAPLPVRAVNELLLGVIAWIRARRYIDQRWDCIVFYSPSIFFGPLVARLRQRRRSRSYLILRDIFPDWAVQAGILRKGPAYYAFKAFESLQYRMADRIGVETTGSLAYFDRGPHAGRVELLRNWTSTNPLRRALDGELRRELGLENKTVFVYGGNMGVAQDMDNIMRLATRMQECSDVHFVLVGSGSEVERLKATVAAGSPRNVTILPSVAQSEYLSVISQFDAGLISLDKRLRSFSTTGKLLGYLRCGLPVLASINPGNDLMQLLTTSGAGLCSWNGDDDNFYRNALTLRSASARKSMARRSYDLLHSEFAVQAAADRILNSVSATGRPPQPLHSPPETEMRVPQTGSLPH